MFLPEKNADPHHINNYSFAYRVFYVMISITLAKGRYYFGWKLGEAVNNAAGFGFNGYENGKARWDLITNVNIMKIETATSLKVLIDNWNIQTGIWLRRICYDRAPVYPTLLTYLLSALWHGYYPGYYFTFISAAFFTMAGRCIRRTIRPFFLTAPWKKALYECVTWVGTQLSLTYLIVPFCLLEFWPTVYYYHYSMHWFLHVAVALVLVILPPTGILRLQQKTE
ncbi:Membrane-bound O-acyltransferase domain-containing protein 2 [Lamellibrachia satsuma]|nr:Membrane-bound O-acyltransferase domain-containing protein 2 [Lamellibrachia satsuma]